METIGSHYKNNSTVGAICSTSISQYISILSAQHHFLYYTSIRKNILNAKIKNHRNIKCYKVTSHCFLKTSNSNLKDCHHLSSKQKMCPRKIVLSKFQMILLLLQILQLDQGKPTCFTVGTCYEYRMLT